MDLEEDRFNSSFPMGSLDIRDPVKGEEKVEDALIGVLVSIAWAILIKIWPIMFGYCDLMALRLRNRVLLKYTCLSVIISM